MHACTHKDLNLNENMYGAVFKVESVWMEGRMRTVIAAVLITSRNIQYFQPYGMLMYVVINLDYFAMRGGDSGLGLGW